MSRKKKTAIAALVALMAALAGIVAVPWLTTGPAHVQVAVESVSPTSEVWTSIPSSRKRSLRVLTLNVAHGRSNRFHQALLGKPVIESNLKTVAGVLRREAPDLVALQESDGPCFWSGDLDHVAFIAQEAMFRFYAHGVHVSGLGLSYGASLLSQWPLKDAESLTFAPSLPTFSKGFVLAEVEVPIGSDRRIDAVSVHLDFSRSSVRRRQAQMLTETLTGRGKPLLLLGDFNCEWAGEEDTLRVLAGKLNVRPYGDETGIRPTMPMIGKSIDWILVSKEFRFLRCEVLPDILSDHQAVLADLEWQGR